MPAILSTVKGGSLGSSKKKNPVLFKFSDDKSEKLKLCKGVGRNVPRNKRSATEGASHHAGWTMSAYTEPALPYFTKVRGK